MNLKFVPIILLFLSYSGTAFAQVNLDGNNVESALTDTTLAKKEGIDMENKNTFRVLFSGNPGRAALYSLILPGAGQAYNKRYWKIPLIYGALGGAGYYFYTVNKTYQETKTDYENDVINFPNVPSNNFNYYISAKKTREQAIFIILGVHLFNSIEAYIDRHLIDFDTDENLSMHLKVSPDPLSTVGFSFNYALK